MQAEKRRWKQENQQEEQEKVQCVTDVDNVVGEGQFEDPVQILVWGSQDILEEKLDLTQCGLMFVNLSVCVYLFVCMGVSVCGPSGCPSCSTASPDRCWVVPCRRQRTGQDSHVSFPSSVFGTRFRDSNTQVTLVMTSSHQFMLVHKVD